MATTLVLEVSQFKFRGSEGSRTFGRPSDVLQKGQIRQILGQLEELLNAEAHENEIRSQPPSPAPPEILARTNYLSSSGPTSQEAFATQVPSRVQKKPESRADNEGPKASAFSSLLNLLSGKNTTAKPSINSTTTSLVPSNTSANTIPRKAVLTPVSSGRILEMTSKLEAKANAQNSQSSLSQERQANSSQSPPISIKLSKPKDAPEPHSDDSEKENSQESSKGRTPILHGLKIETVEQVTIEPESIQMSITDQFQDKNPFLGLKRVPRRFVRIQQSQETLLEDKESWYKPPVDSRSTYANLPAKVRDDLIALSERQPAVKTSTEGGQANEVDSDDLDDGDEAQHESSACPSAAVDEDEKPEVQQSSTSTDEEEDQVESPGSSPKRHARSRGSQKFATDSHDRQNTSFSSSKPDHPGDEIAESYKSESDVMEDEDIVSWPSSPEHQLMAVEHGVESHDRPYNSANNLAESSQISGSNRRQSPDVYLDAGPGTQFSESIKPSLGRHRDDSEQQHPQTTRRLWPPVTIPPSSPTDEKELEYAIPYAIGDFVEESDTEEEPSETFQTHPSTAIHNEELVQVEQTPFPQLRYSSETSLQTEKVDESLKETKQIEDLISSDPRIPATCEDRAPERTTPSSSEATSLHKGLDMRVLTIDYTYDGPQHASYLHAKISIKEEDGDDDVAQNPLLNKNEASNIGSDMLSTTQDAISLDMVAGPPGPHQEGYIAAVTPSRNQGSRQLATQHSSPLATPHSTKSQLDVSSPVMMGSGKRIGDHLEARPQTSAKRRRYVPRGVARMIKEENSPARDTKEIARINRHNFNDNLPPARENTTTLLSSSDQGNSREKEVIPSTNPRTTRRSTSSPEPAMQSSARDDVLYVPATFEEPASTSQSAVLRNDKSPMQSIEIDHYPYHDPASPNDVMDASCVSDAEEDDAILRGTFLPMTEHTAHSQVDFYEEFVHIYPAYLGSKNAFARALVNIEWIRENDLFLPWARYDDFIRVLASDWLDYIEKNRGLGGKLMSGLRYYEMNFPDQPIFEYKFITGENLQDALASLDAEQVAEYRGKYREPLQKEVRQAQTPKSNSSDTVATGHFITMDLDSEEQTPTLDSREPSLELGSTNGSVFDRHRIFHGREASPELGSAKNSIGTSNLNPKLPFFETHSQLPIAQRRVLTPKYRRSGLLEVEASEPQGNSSRVLPWNKEDLTSSPQSSSRLEVNFSTSTTPIRRGRLSPKGQPSASSSSSPSRHLVRSPLGVARSESSRPAKRIRKGSSTTSSHDPADLKRRSLPTSSASSLIQPGSSRHAANPERITPKRPMLQEFLARRNKQGSTPKSTPGKRFCTKPARTLPRQLEPETQGWDM